MKRTGGVLSSKYGSAIYNMDQVFNLAEFKHALIENLNNIPAEQNR